MRRSSSPSGLRALALATLFAGLPACLVNSAFDEYCRETGRCPADAGPLDAGGTDAGATDSGPPDSGRPDAGPTDGGPSDGGGAGSDGGFDGGSESCPTCGGVSCCPSKGRICAAGPRCCVAEGNSCESQYDCCSNQCTGNKCSSSSCVPNGAPCNTPSQCCSGQCQGVTCTATGGACSSVIGAACTGGSDCCPTSTTGAPLGTRCDPVSAKCVIPQGLLDAGIACWTGGTLCLPYDRCCEGSCSAGVCPHPVTACGNAGAGCGLVSDCCTGLACDFSTGSPTCQSPPSTSLPDGWGCRTHAECQSQYCDPANGPGRWRCATPSGCKLAGGSCSPTCCPGNQCQGGAQCCAGPGSLCISAADCCTPASCYQGLCQYPIPGGKYCVPVAGAPGLCQVSDGSYCKSPGLSCTAASECCSNQCSNNNCGY